MKFDLKWISNSEEAFHKIKLNHIITIYVNIDLKRNSCGLYIKIESRSNNT